MLSATDEVLLSMGVYLGESKSSVNDAKLEVRLYK
jgi:hypothetical protein